MSESDHPIVLFDGVCNFCNSSVNFIIDRDPKRVFRFAALQSTAGQTLCKQHPSLPTTLDSIVVIDGGRPFTRSSAILRIVRRLSGLWPMFGLFRIVPSVLRDPIYDFIARRRYAWFGKSDVCRIPTPDLRERFLE